MMYAGFEARYKKDTGEDAPHVSGLPAKVPECWKKGDPPLGFKKALEISGTSCSNCGKITVPKQFSLCAGCNHAIYCDKACQKANWKAHKMDCMIFQSAFA